MVTVSRVLLVLMDYVENLNLSVILNKELLAIVTNVGELVSSNAMEPVLQLHLMYHLILEKPAIATNAGGQESTNVMGCVQKKYSASLQHLGINAGAVAPYNVMVLATKLVVQEAKSVRTANASLP